jgi:hypothetical protein
MNYELNDPNRTPEWYFQAGESMQKKANYLRLGIYNINRMLEDTDKKWSWSQKKDMQHEKGILDAALKRIAETFIIRCRDLQAMPEHLQAFRDGYLGS